MTPLPGPVVGAGHDKPDAEAQLALHDLGLSIFAYFVLTTGAVVWRDLYERGMLVSDFCCYNGFVLEILHRVDDMMSIQAQSELDQETIRLRDDECWIQEEEKAKQKKKAKKTPT